MRKTTILLASLLFTCLAREAGAQNTTPVPPATAPSNGFLVDRFNPSERGSEWFALDTLDLRGAFRPAIGVVGEYADKPFVLYNADGSTRADVVKDQLTLHVGASLVIFDRVRMGLNLPFTVVNDGTGATSLRGNQFLAPTKPAASDFRVGLDIRLLGEYGSPFTLALGGQFFVPAGTANQYTSDNLSHGIVRLAAAGESGVFVWALNLGYHVRAQQTFVDGNPYGNAVVYGAAAGVRVADRHLVVGPEIYGEAVTTNDGFFKAGSTPVEAILGAHYTIGEDWRIGAGAGPGLTHDLGSPEVRVLGSIEWVPGYHPPPPKEEPKAEAPPPPAPKPSDRDGDGILDKDDACPDVPGVKTDDPKTNGCPPDRDGDGIPDAQDACPDTPGVKTDNPKTNGCPPDRDGDGIPDAQDACPDVPGVKTDNPKTNGCPSDRDGDGIVDSEDACPDAPGPHTDDPKTNGCPKAAVVNGQIRISEQVKFATGSAKILRDSDDLLTAVARVILDHSEIKKIRVEGHTDNVGKPAMNKKLSQDRARSVKEWLEKHGIPKDRLSAEGFGMDRPIDSNETEAGRKNNRRVEFHIE
jgi:OmpA-OmpF porin, OOP family